MQSFKTNDNVTLKYIDTGLSDTPTDLKKPWLVLIHGFTGSSAVWQRNIPTLAKDYRVIAPDLRGHGENEKCKHGYHVMRLAQDLRELVLALQGSIGPDCNTSWKAIGGSLGCSILWFNPTHPFFPQSPHEVANPDTDRAYASLFTTAPFTHMIFVDQAPLQNSDPASGWDQRFCNRGMNNPLAVAGLQATLAIAPELAHKGTIAACLSYRAFPLETDNITPEKHAADEDFFLKEAMKGDAEWYGKLMADHTALDWRDAIRRCYGKDSGSQTKVLVLTSTRSGCFPADGPLQVVELVNGGKVEEKATGRAVPWGGHWMYWENPENFNSLCLDFLARAETYLASNKASNA